MSIDSLAHADSAELLVMFHTAAQIAMNEAAAAEFAEILDSDKKNLA